MCERTKDDFLTVTKKTYTKKVGYRPDKASFSSDYPDILAGPFTEYLVPEISPTPPYENISHCYERLLSENSKLRRHLEQEPDIRELTKLLQKGRTVYQVDYCEIEGGFESARSRARKRIDLPPDWGEIPQTTHRASYRQPASIATWKLSVPPILPTPSSLAPNPKERKILKVCTGDSEYMGRICALAEEVMRDQLHGHHNFNRECLIYKKMVEHKK